MYEEYLFIAEERLFGIKPRLLFLYATTLQILRHFLFMGYPKYCIVVSIRLGWIGRG